MNKKDQERINAACERIKNAEIGKQVLIFDNIQNSILMFFTLVGLKETLQDEVYNAIIAKGKELGQDGCKTIFEEKLRLKLDYNIMAGLFEEIVVYDLFITFIPIIPPPPIKGGKHKTDDSLVLMGISGNSDKSQTE